uniref:ISXO2-like transposase domain-containing protein n=1 Tax=Ditylenchus dipsaci TaxID=166011 RepID=A0A915DEK8_9BILA
MALARDGRAKSSRWTISELDRLAANEDNFLAFLDLHHVVPLDRVCPKCDKPGMTIQKRKNMQVRFRCGKRVALTGKSCNGEIGLLKSTFLQGSKTPILVVLKFIYLWLSNMELQKICDEIGLGTDAAVEWARFCRRAVYQEMILNGNAIGGLGDVVEIDESKFGKRKYNRGKRIEGSWVFGGISRKTGNVFMVQVEKRDRATLIPLVRQWNLPGTVIIADCWKAYDVLDQLDYELLRVNHSLTFKTPADEIPDVYPEHIRNQVHTNSIEATWGAVKRMVFRQPGNRTRRHLPGNLAKYLFIKQCRLRNADPFVAMLSLCNNCEKSFDETYFFESEDEYDRESLYDSPDPPFAVDNQLPSAQQELPHNLPKRRRMVIESDSDRDSIASNTIDNDKNYHINKKNMVEANTIDSFTDGYPCEVNSKLSTKWHKKWYCATCIQCSIDVKGKKFIKVQFEDGTAFNYFERNWKASVCLLPRI